jgi:hypothetical protein
LLNLSSIKGLIDRLVVGVPNVENCRQLIEVVVVAIEEKFVPISVRSETEKQDWLQKSKNKGR